MRTAANPDDPPVINVDAARPGDGHTPLALAVTQAHLVAVRSLLDHGANPNQIVQGPKGKGGDKLSPLLLALSYTGQDADVNERAELVANLLMDMGADVNGLGGEEGGLTAVWQAVNTSKYGCIAELLRRGADPNFRHQGIPPIILAVQRSSMAALERLAEHPLTDLNMRGDVDGGPGETTALIEAVRNHKRPRGPHVVKFLLEARGGSGVDVTVVNAAGESAASLALSMLASPSDTLAKLQLLERLLDRPVPARLHGLDLEETLVEVVRFREKATPILRKLVGVGGADPDSPDGRPLAAALQSAHPSSTEMVKVLIEAKANPNRVPTGAYAPLILAVKNVIEELDKRRAKVIEARVAEAKRRNGGGFRGARGSLVQPPTAVEEAAMAAAEAKLELIASAEGLEKDITDDAPPHHTPADLFIARHSRAVERLEATGPDSFWGTLGSAAAGGAAGGATAGDEYGMDAIADQQAAMRAARAETEKLVALVEATPTKREMFLARVSFTASVRVACAMCLWSFSWQSLKGCGV